MSAPAPTADLVRQLQQQLRAQQEGGYGVPASGDAAAIHLLPLFTGERDQHLAALDELQRSGVIAGHSYIDASSGPAVAVVDVVS